MILAVFLWMAYATWLILSSEWSRLAGLLMVVLGWLLGAGLP